MKLTHNKINHTNYKQGIGHKKTLFYIGIITSLLILSISSFIIVTSYLKILFKSQIEVSQPISIEDQVDQITEVHTTIETSTTSLEIKNEEKIKQKTNIETQQMIMYSTLRHFGISEQNTRQITKATFEELPNISKYGFTYEDVIALIYLESAFKNHSPYWDNHGVAVGYFSIHNVALNRVKKHYPHEFGHIKNNKDLLKSPYYQTKVALRYIYIIIQSEIKDSEKYCNLKYYVLSRYNGRTTNLYDNVYIRIFKNRLSQVKSIIQKQTTTDL